MKPAPRYEFRRATMEDLAQLTHWQSQPHMRPWWDDDEPFDAEALADPRVRRWIVSLDAQPFGYMQDYAVQGWQAHHFAELPDGARGIDQYIGEVDMLARGHGRAMIAQRMQALFREGAPLIATDPHPDNARAIAVYEKLGFEIAGPAQETKWGVILPMHAHPARRIEAGMFEAK